MFNECHNLLKIEGINKLNTSQVTNMTTMFQECNKIKELDLTSFDT
jgi:surface protein